MQALITTQSGKSIVTNVAVVTMHLNATCTVRGQKKHAQTATKNFTIPKINAETLTVLLQA